MEAIQAGNVQELVEMCVDPPVQLHDIGKEFTIVFLATLLYCIWNIRNGKVHGKDFNFLEELKYMESMTEDYVWKFGEAKLIKEEKREHWKPLEEG